MATSVYLKVKTATGSSVWRNIAPGTNTNGLNWNSDDMTADTTSDLIGKFVKIQTETPDLDDGKFQVKFVEETTNTYTPSSANATVPGTDAWLDTSNEKLVLTFMDTNEDKNYKLTINKAATEIQSTVSGADLEGAVTSYASGLAVAFYNSGADDLSWLQAHITGTKDSLVAQSD